MRFIPALLTVVLFAVGCSNASEPRVSDDSVITHEDDSTVYIKSDSLEGVIFRRNFSLHYPETAYREASDVSVLKHFVINDSIAFRETSVAEVLQFESDFFEYYPGSLTEGLKRPS